MAKTIDFYLFLPTIPWRLKAILSILPEIGGIMSAMAFVDAAIEPKWFSIFLKTSINSSTCLGLNDDSIFSPFVSL